MAQSSALIGGDDERVAHLLASYRERLAPQLAHMHDTSAEVGMIPDHLIRPPDGKVESSASVELMLRVAYALVAPMTVKDDNGAVREALTHEKAVKAGCPVEVWHQLARHPEFKTIYMQVLESTVLLPSLPKAVRAQSQKAAMGDKDAFDNMQKMMRLGDNPDEEGQRAVYRSMDDETFLRAMAELTDKQVALYGNLTAKRTTKDRTREILDGEDVIAPPPPEDVIDHAKIHGDAGNQPD